MFQHAQSVIVSGGSRGLGLAIVERLLGKGCRVATFARHITPALDELGKAYPNSLYVDSFDARDLASIDQFLAACVERMGPVHGLVNNAAMGQDHLLAHMPTELVTDILGTNLIAPILLSRAVVRHMLVTGGQGRIVSISSICGSRGFAALTVYSAAKAGIEAFTRSLAREVSSRGILVNCIAPGFFLSEMSSVLAPQQIETIRRRTPTERLSTEHDVFPVLDLLLFAQTNITGQTLAVDGGMSF